MILKNVAVLMGGISREREVSLRSGAAVARGLRKSGYQVQEIDLTSAELTVPSDIQAVFIALHGEFGEDGTIQKILERMKLPYTGSSPEASRNAFDKLLSKKVLIRNGIMTPPYEILRPGEARSMPLPVVVKPLRQGSSLGVHCVVSEDAWPAALADALTHNGEVLVEEFIPGRELTVGLVQDRALPVIEIRAPGDNYDYHAKYTQGATQYIVPASVSRETAELCSGVAKRTFLALGAAGYGRVDFRLHNDGTLYVLELNTIPGFTETSLLPKAAAAAGLGFPELCAMIMRQACLKTRRQDLIEVGHVV
ncbi:MAG: D-alanine--D-alanine ligase [Kiritimatiellia bacterium]|nr:D-alanine--D-alanine ligase [Lentisphaerota bacterium]